MIRHCSECHMRAKGCKEVRLGVWVCKRCWLRLDYDLYIGVPKEKETV